MKKLVITAIAVLIAFSPVIENGWGPCEVIAADTGSQKGQGVRVGNSREFRSPQRRVSQEDRGLASAEANRHAAAERADKDRQLRAEINARNNDDLRGTGTMTRYRPTSNWKSKRNK
jgi:hypothetical protein